MGVWSLTLWCKVKFKSYIWASQNTIFTLSATNDDYNEITIRADNDDNRWECRITWTTYDYISRLQPSPKPIIWQLYDVKLVYDRDNDILKLFLDWIKVWENTWITFKLSSSNKKIKIANYFHTTSYSDIEVFSPKIRNRALTQSEIQQEFYLNYI